MTNLFPGCLCLCQCCRLRLGQEMPCALCLSLPCLIPDKWNCARQNAGSGASGSGNAFKLKASLTLLLFLWHLCVCNDRRDEPWRNNSGDAEKGFRSPFSFCSGLVLPNPGYGPFGITPSLLICSWNAQCRQGAALVSKLTFFLD